MKRTGGVAFLPCRGAWDVANDAVTVDGDVAEGGIPVTPLVDRVNRDAVVGEPGTVVE